jgi:asparagine synthase (glutamine-hydrolysing)
MPEGTGALMAGAIRAVPRGAWRGLAHLIPERQRPPQLDDKMAKLAGVLDGGRDNFYRLVITHWPQAEALVAGAAPPRFIADDPRVAGLVENPIERMQYLDSLTYLPDDILTKVDIASMTHSLEARAPFCDHHVAELGAALPGRLKLRAGKGKYILKKAFADLIPDEILNRKKKGFSLPTARWFRGRLFGFARELLLSDAARARGLFEPTAVEDLLNRHRAGEDHGERLWNLVVLETWYRELVDGRGAFAKEIAARATELQRQPAVARPGAFAATGRAAGA